MSKAKRILKWSLIIIAILVISIVSFGAWFMSLLPESKISREELERTEPTDLPYLIDNIITNRGKILAVVTSTDTMGISGKSTGYEHTELARAYYVFEANGYEVDIASPLGGEPPVVLDKGDMKEFDYAFLNDTKAQLKVRNSIPLHEVNSNDYEAIYFVGGKGAMFDFPDNQSIQRIVKDYYENGKVIAAVCHGPAALSKVKLNEGKPLVFGKKVCGFTNEEELLLISNAREIFPFLLQDKLEENGASFSQGVLYLNNVVVDGNLVTGQNPWSIWGVAESVIKQLGHTPKPRRITEEENGIAVLNVYHSSGKEAAKNVMNEYAASNKMINAEILAIHSLLSAYQLKLGQFYDLTQLLRYRNSVYE